MLKRVLLASGLLLVLLVGCGGGGGGGSLPEPEGFIVSGTVLPDALNRADSDTNDPETPALRNDLPSEAQPLVAPAVVGGFVAAPGTASRFGTTGDQWDLFVVDLQQGQQIVLEFPDPGVADLDLYLADGSGVLVDASLGVEARETLMVPSDGRYVVAVHAYSGRSNYLLRIDAAGTFPAHALPRGPRLSDDFVAGEMIVLLRPVDEVPESKGTIAAVMTHGLETVVGDGSREQLWRITDAAAVQALGLPAVPAGALVWLERAGTEMLAAHRTLMAIKAVQQLPDVQQAAPNHVLRTQLLPNDPLQGLQWYHRNIDLPRAWDLSTGLPPDREVIIAVIDTGVFLDHEDLRDRLVSGYDFIANPQRSGDGDGIDANPDDPGDSALPGRSSWHGTHVAGIAAAASDNLIGIAGVSWGARVMPVRTIGRGGGTVYDTLQGVRFAAGLPNDSGTVPARSADVINLSLGGGAFSPVEAALYQQIRDLGIFVVASAGNSGGSVIYPAAYDSVFAVGATDALNQRAFYSAFGAGLDLVAPGGDMRVDRTGDGYADGILSTVADDIGGIRRSDYAFRQGTSMASPVVAGVIALARAVRPELTPSTFLALLASGALTDDLGPAGWDVETGWGQINALKTLSAVIGLADGGVLPPTLSAAPQRLQFGFTATELDLLLRKSGTGELSVVAVSADAGWLAVTPQEVTADGFGVYRVRVERQGLAPGNYSGRIRFGADTGADLEVEIAMGVAPRELTRDTVGRIYVLLLDENDDVVAETGLDPGEGGYAYRFEGVPAGNYRIAAGTDMNDDLVICDPGEACGAFPTLSLFERVMVDRDLFGLDFTVGFQNRPLVQTLSREQQPVVDRSFLRRGGNSEDPTGS